MEVEPLPPVAEVEEPRSPFGQVAGTAAELAPISEVAPELAQGVSATTWRKGIRVWGLVDGPDVVHSLDDLLQLFESKTRVVA
eukprot:1642870-Prymnesium_polylepis.1